MPTDPDGNRGRVIETAHLFRQLLKELIGLLRGLDAHQWELTTAAGAWSVKDVAAHLLDGDLRRLSSGRDGHAPPPPAEPITSYDTLLRYLNALNADWVRSAQRLSPRVLCDYLELAGAEVADHVESSNPSAAALYPVAWAGQQTSAMWMDIGREYTERWHHQDQIREAVGAPALREKELLRPALEISLFALPHAYRETHADQGTSVHLSVTGEAGGEWQLIRDSGWQIRSGRASHPAATVRVGDLELTRMLMHRIAFDRLASVIQVSGDANLAAPLMAARAVMV